MTKLISASALAIALLPVFAPSPAAQDPALKHVVFGEHCGNQTGLRGC